MTDKKDSRVNKLHLAVAALPAIPSVLLIWFWTEAGTFLSNQSGNTLAAAALVMLVLIAILSMALINLRPWLQWDEPTGTWISRMDGLRYCEACKNKSDKLSPLKNEVTGWRCMSCKVFHVDPARRHLIVTTPPPVIATARPRWDE
jgi:hypothetical protein